VNYHVGDIKLVSSIAPVDFQGPRTPTRTPSTYHLWTARRRRRRQRLRELQPVPDVPLHDRAQQYRQLDLAARRGPRRLYHNGGGSSVASRPLPSWGARTPTRSEGYLFPLVERYIDANVPAQDYLTRQWESFHPARGPRSRTPA
jgi:hypothetical protein